ncbi:6731_t:CDS:2, partial [Racocetra persica]
AELKQKNIKLKEELQIEREEFKKFQDKSVEYQKKREDKIKALEEQIVQKLKEKQETSDFKKSVENHNKEQKKDQELTSFCKLNNDDFYLILQNLKKDRSTLYNCLLVNRQFCRLTVPLIWDDPFFRLGDSGQESNKLPPEVKNKIEPTNASQKNTLFPYPDYLKCFDNRQAFKYVSNWCKEKGIKEEKLHFETSRVIQGILLCLGKNIEMQVSKQVEKLHRVEIDFYDNIPASYQIFFQNLIEDRPKSEQFRLENVESVPLMTSSILCRLELYNVRFTKENLQNLSNLPSLKILIISKTRKEKIYPLKKCCLPSLQKLELLENYTGLDEFFLDNIQAEALKTLAICNIEQIFEPNTFSQK